MNNLFFFIRKTNWTPDGPFEALEYQKVLYPVLSKLSNEVFISGKGWCKSKKRFTITPFSGTTPEDIESYISKYSDECFFYSITGRDLHETDVVSDKMRQEFRSVKKTIGFKEYQVFITEINRLNKIIYDQIMDKNGVDIFKYDEFQTTKQGKLLFRDPLFYIMPRHSMFFYFTTAPNLDPVIDDDWLFKHSVVLNGSDWTHANLPVSVKDRLSFLFGEEVSSGYEKLMKKYSISGKEK